MSICMVLTYCTVQWLQYNHVGNAHVGHCIRFKVQGLFKPLSDSSIVSASRDRYTWKYHDTLRVVYTKR